MLKIVFGLVRVFTVLVLEIRASLYLTPSDAIFVSKF